MRKALLVVILAILCTMPLADFGKAQDQKTYIYLPLTEKTAATRTFDTGQKIVGTDILPGTYRTRSAATGCYWARLSGFGGTFAEIIANESTNGPTVVTIEAGDKGFESSKCGTWTTDLSPITSDASAPVAGDGLYIVNSDMESGLWRSETSSSCYWERLRGFSGRFADIIANDNVEGPALVQIAPTDRGFHAERCGTWAKVE